MASFEETARPTVTHMLEGAGTWVASRRSVETKADRAVLGGLAERIGAGTGTLAMVGARTYKAVGLSQAREGYRTEFYIHLVPANV